MDFSLLKLIFVAIVVVLLASYWVFSFVILYHLARFGVGVQPKKLAAVFLLGSVALFLICMLFSVNLDWNSIDKQLGRLAEGSFNITAPR